MPDGTLLGGAYEPFTRCVYAVEAPLDDVARYLRAWRAGLGQRPRWTTHQGSLETLLPLLEPTAIPSWKALWVEAGAWTAVLTQGDDLSWVAHLAGALGTRVIRASASPHVVRDGVVVRYGDTALWLWAPDERGGYRQVRTIQASNQDRWVWHDDGERLPFENLARYSSRLVRDRFDAPLLDAYCRALGFGLADPASYGPRAVLEEQDTSDWPQHGRTMPSAQWRAEHA
ncbi:hypothetical protein [Occultella kanbiaonis]|uniref:hypothetical protein n=1 Tax=Occultella kanbiaonis TaxID=2675754 RepID=UPI0013CFE1CE|nr:hypothetical protein [Occultella kanbiaonis]